jgi:hypothetical protein
MSSRVIGINYGIPIPLFSLVFAILRNHGDFMLLFWFVLLKRLGAFIKGDHEGRPYGINGRNHRSAVAMSQFLRFA